MTKAGCISFNIRKYEVGLNFIGYKADVIYNPADTAELVIVLDLLLFSFYEI